MLNACQCDCVRLVSTVTPHRAQSRCTHDSRIRTTVRLRDVGGLGALATPRGPDQQDATVLLQAGAVGSPVSGGLASRGTRGRGRLGCGGALHARNQNINTWTRRHHERETGAARNATVCSAAAPLFGEGIVQRKEELQKKLMAFCAHLSLSDVKFELAVHMTLQVPA